MIAFDLVAVSPMSSISGNVAYMEYIKGTTKGQSKEGQLTNSIWELGDVDVNYTGQIIVEPGAASFTPSFEPVAGAMVNPKDGKGYKYKNTAENGDVTYSDTAATETTSKVAYVYDNVTVPQDKLPTLKAQLTNIALEAKPRRIAIYYSQLAAFQA